MEVWFAQSQKMVTMVTILPLSTVLFSTLFYFVESLHVNKTILYYFLVFINIFKNMAVKSPKSGFSIHNLYGHKWIILAQCVIINGNNLIE